MTTTRAAAILVVGLTVAEATAAAQTKPTCSFDPTSATVTVNVNGRRAAVTVEQPSGAILLGLESCGGATVTSTDSIEILGSAFNDYVDILGNFAPGLTPELDGASEIEIRFDLGDGWDDVDVIYGAGKNRVILTSSGIDTGDDGDRDITTAGTEDLSISGGGGDDLINAAAYTGTPPGGQFAIEGGDGNDRLTGSGGNNFIDAGPGDDVVFGEGGNDRIIGRDGADILDGGPGNDRFESATAFPEGADVMRGGPGNDTANYRLRFDSITVTLGNGLADDGAAGEGDSVEADVENVIGGRSDDVLVGSTRRNLLDGREGNDELHGGSNGDVLVGYDGNDFIAGDDGADDLDGGAGDDILAGGAGADSVLCGQGTDDAEDDPLDTLTGCEL